MGRSLVKVPALAVVVLTASTKAHNQMEIPLATWPDGFYGKNSPSGLIDSTSVLPLPKGMTYSADSESNIKAYWTAFNDSKYKTLKEMAFETQTLKPGATNECGFALIDGEPQELPDAVEWDKFDHQGPCEVWCDEELAFSNWNCHNTFPGAPAKLPYDKTICEGKGVLLSLYLALHMAPWQIYADCVPIKGGSGGKKSTTPAAATPAASSGSGTPPATPSGPATPSAAPEADQTDSEGTDSADSGNSDTPATPSETATPSATPSEAATPPATPSEAATPPAASEADQTDSKGTDLGDSGTPVTPISPSNDKCSVRRRH